MPMPRTMEELRKALHEELARTRYLYDEIEKLRAENRARMSRADHERIVERMCISCERCYAPSERPHNERGAGRKKKATKEMVSRALELSARGLSCAQIAAALSEETGIALGRSTIWNILRGSYTPREDGPKPFCCGNPDDMRKP